MNMNNFKSLARILELTSACLILSLPASFSALAVEAPPAKAAAAPNVLPDRLFNCSIGHITNFDPRIDQTPDQLHFDAYHVFKLFLPAITAPVGRPPDAIEDAPPVDPRTRILSDPDHISGQPTDHFDRIIDLWPERVELSASIKGPLLNAIAIYPIDTEHGTASLFMMRATELTHYQPDHFYWGRCQITTGASARDGTKL